MIWLSVKSEKEGVIGLNGAVASGLMGEIIRGLDRDKRAGYYKAQIWDDSRAVRGVFTAIDRFEYILKGSY